METEPADDVSIVVPETIKSCLTCRHSGYVEGIERKCLRSLQTNPVEYRTCFFERTEGECGQSGQFFELPFTRVLPKKKVEPIPLKLPPVMQAAIDRTLPQNRPIQNWPNTVDAYANSGPSMFEIITMVVVVTVLAFGIGFLINR